MENVWLAKAPLSLSLRRGSSTAATASLLRRIDEVTCRDVNMFPWARIERVAWPFWISLAVGVMVNLCWHFYRVWLPRHLVVDLQFTDHQLQYLLMAFYLTADVGSIAIGFLTRRLVSAQRSVERARKIAILLAAFLCLMPMPILFGPGRMIMVPLYCLAGAGIMGVFVLFYVFAQDISPAHTSKCVGLIGAFAWFINSKLHPLVGHYADTHSPTIGKFAPMIVVAGVLPVLAALVALAWPEERKMEKMAEAHSLSVS